MIKDLQTRAIRRTRILQGQMAGLEKMIDQEKYCMDILTQSLAIQKSIGSLNKLILENHLRTHVTAMLSANDSKAQDTAVQELLGLYELNNIRGKS